jgi:hypothetical protein
VTIRVTRFRRQYYRSTVEVLLGGKLVARLAPGVSGDIHGNGRPQPLVVRSPGFTESAPLDVTDPGRDRLLGVVVSYTVHRRLFSRGEKILKAEVMGDPIDYVPPSPV